MARLIDIQDAATCPSPLAVRNGDVLLFRAAGARLGADGEAVVELLGSFVPAVLAGNGEVLSPMGPPDTVLLLARQPGQASIVVITGDPFHSPRETALCIVVEA